jgi:hypothetical protein
LFKKTDFDPGCEEHRLDMRASFTSRGVCDAATSCDGAYKQSLLPHRCLLLVHALFHIAWDFAGWIASPCVLVFCAFAAVFGAVRACHLCRSVFLLGWA